MNCFPEPTLCYGRGAGVFTTTHWSIVVKAGDGGSPEAATAMERLCQTYWYPLYCFVRRKGHRHEDACDLTQSFFARLLEKNFLGSVDANLGRFRTFLLTSMSYFLANEWDKSRAQRRGGNRPLISLDATAEERYKLVPLDHASPDRLFDKRWAETMISVVVDRLAAEMEERRFEALKGFLVEAKGAVSYEEAANDLGISVAAVTSAIHRLRGRFRALLYDEVANTVDNDEDVEEELRQLLAALSD